MVLHSQHSIVIEAPAEEVYSLIAEVNHWPVIFSPTVYTEHIERSQSAERFRIWALANGAVKNWSSRRTLDPVAKVITFDQEVSQPPVASMGGSWSFTETSGGTEVVLRHHFTAVDDAPEAVRWITEVLDTNSAAELAGLRKAAEVSAPAEDLVFTFADSVQVNGPVAMAYQFINEVDQWPSRCPTCSGWTCGWTRPVCSTWRWIPWHRTVPRIPRVRCGCAWTRPRSCTSRSRYPRCCPATVAAGRSCLTARRPR